MATLNLGWFDVYRVMEGQVSLVKEEFDGCGFTDAGLEFVVMFVDVVSEFLD